MKQVFLILHNIRSTYNVGAIFRTADAAGVTKIYLAGYTPAPVDQFGRSEPGIAKTAIGAEKNIPWEKVKSTAALVKKLKGKGVQVIALEQAPSSLDYKKIKLALPAAIVLGEEVKGISTAILNKCDLIAEIPMKGKKESLNVSVAAGIALFRLLGI